VEANGISLYKVHASSYTKNGPDGAARHRAGNAVAHPGVQDDMTFDGGYAFPFRMQEEFLAALTYLDAQGGNAALKSAAG